MNRDRKKPWTITQIDSSRKRLVIENEAGAPWFGTLDELIGHGFVHEDGAEMLPSIETSTITTSITFTVRCA